MSQTESSIIARVVEAVARASGADPQALPPLYEAIEPDALEALYAHASADSAERTAPTVLFSYAGYEVSIRSATDIEVRERTIESAGSTET